MFFSAAIVAIALDAASADSQLDAAVRAQQQSLGLIRSIQLHYVSASTDDTNKGVEVWWSMQGRRERIRSIALGAKQKSEGPPTGIDDLLIDGESFAWLRNWDADRPQKISPTYQGTVRASDGPFTAANPSAITPSVALLFETHFAPRYSLTQLSRISPKAEYKGKETLDGRSLVLLSFESPEDSATVKWVFDVYLDPSAGYLTRKLVRRAPRIDLGGGRFTSDVGTQEVEEFREFGDGIYIPTRIKATASDGRTAVTAVDSVKVNQPIPEDTFVMRWPRYALVTHYPPVQGRFQVDVWGDGKPLRRVTNHDEVVSFENELRKDPAIQKEFDAIRSVGQEFRTPSSFFTKWVIVSLSMGVLLIVIVAVRRMSGAVKQ